jgi:hypothetical protein
MAKKKGPSARDLAEISSGKASARDKKEAGGMTTRKPKGKRRAR